MLQSESNKLFYNKYLYKFVFRNSLATIFRDKNFNCAKEVLDELYHRSEKGMPLVRSTGYRQFTIEPHIFYECVTIYHELKNTNVDYKIRIEHPSVHVYSNDKSWLLLFATKISDPISFAAPPKELIKHVVPNTIIVDENTGYDYKVTFGDYNIDPGFNTWLDKNEDKVKMGVVCRDAIRESLHCANYYFYVRDERVLNLIKLMIAPSIRRIDKLVCKQDIDK